MDLDNYHECPKCAVTWDGNEIPNGLMTTGHYKNREAAEDAAQHYGWTPENHKVFKINVIGIELPGYDGVAVWKCTTCNTTWNRFTGCRIGLYEIVRICQGQERPMSELINVVFTQLFRDDVVSVNRDRLETTLSWLRTVCAEDEVFEIREKELDSC